MGESFQPLLSTGAASMSVPIMLPPGRAGLQPSLSFSYLSSRGSGILGIGWDIPVPFISRQTDKGMPRYDRNSLDRFIYNGGEELVPVAAPADTSDCEVEVWYDVPYYAGESGGWVADPIVRNVEVLPEQVCGWWYFRTKLEGAFMRFFMNPAQNRWIVQDKGGTLYYFGETGASRIEFDGGAKIFQWNLTRVVDVHGNITLYEYEKSQGQSYLRHAWWNVRLDGDGAPWTDCSPARDCYGHHVELVYDRGREDVLTSYASGYGVTTAWRLSRVRVESVDLETELWRHTRDYDLVYDGSSYYSLLESIQLLGRDRADSLPQMTFGYTQVEAKRMDGGSGLEISGFGGFDERLWDFSMSPPHSVDDARADLFDANSDGFADLLVTDPARYADGHGLFVAFCDGSWNCSYRQADEPLYLHGAFSVGTDFTLSNTNINPMDIDSDGVVEFLHMPHLRDYGYYRIEKTTPVQDLYSGYRWASEGPFDPQYVDPDIDFTRDAAEIQLVDLDNDHMVDVVKTAGTRMEHWLNLGRCEGGEGKFGTPRYDAYGKCTGFTKEPITSCVLYRGLPKKFSDGDLRLVDMNGDGMQDIVHLRQGDVAWWAGRGPGVWGDGGECPAGTYGDDRETVMDGSYWEMNPEVHEVFLSDVNADGLADILQVRFDAVDVWLNTSGTGFLSRYVISRTPAHPGFTNRVRFADVDGTGTPDILWGDAGNYRYMDLMGRTKPRVLNRIENGLGKVTTIEYVPSTKFYVEDVENGREVNSVPPFPSFVVSRVTVSDSLGWEQATEYAYHDGYYDGCEGEFRGFQENIVKSLGDDNSPTSWTQSSFHTGARPAGTQCLEDNPYEGLKGKPSVVEEYDDLGVYLESIHSRYRVVKLFDGIDGRNVWYTYADRSEEFIYDTSHFRPSSDGICEERASIVLESDGETRSSMECVPLRSTDYSVVVSESGTDLWGNVTYQAALGIEGMEGDETVSRSGFAIVGTWIHRPYDTFIEGSVARGDASASLNHRKIAYDAKGQITHQWARHERPSSVPEISGGWSLTQGQWYLQSRYGYTAAGMVQNIWEGGDETDYLRHRFIGYDPGFGAYAEVEQIEASEGVVLENVVRYDSGYALPLEWTGYNGEKTNFDYSSLGQIERVYKPWCAEPSTIYEYVYTSPVSRIHILSNERCDVAGEHDPGEAILAVTESDGGHGYEEYRFIDGIARLRAIVSEGDEDNPWIVSSHAVYDRKGNAKGTYQAYGIASVSEFNPTGAPASLLVRIRYDAFGREAEKFTADGEDSVATEYGLLRDEVWDGEDQRAGKHFGTPIIRYFDGQKKEIFRIELLRKEDGSLSGLAQEFSYDALGNRRSIRKGALLDYSDPGAGWNGLTIENRFYYDSLGRRIFEQDADSGEYFYDMNILGDLVKAQDARGVVNAYGYDLAGRLVWEDLGSDGTQDVVYGFDVPFDEAWYYTAECHSSDEAAECPQSQHFLMGKLSWMEDRSGRTIYGYDARGRIVWKDRQVSRFEPGLDGIGGTRVDDLSQFWHTEKEYDEMDRVVSETYPEEGAVASYSYSTRGLLERVELIHDRSEGTKSGGSSADSWGKGADTDTKERWFSASIFRERMSRIIVGILKEFGWEPWDLKPEKIESAEVVIERISYNARGQKVEVIYGDAARTMTRYEYDARQRLVRLTTLQTAYAPSESDPPSERVLIDYGYRYDHADNIVAIDDFRDAALVGAWGPVPVNYRYEYDSLYRLARAVPTYHEAQPDRIGPQTWGFNRLGSMASWTEPAHQFYRWSLGSMKNGLQLLDEGTHEVDGRAPAPHALYQAFDFDEGAGEGGYLQAHYDAAGNMTGLEVFRGCRACDPSSYTCTECGEEARYEYLWDEVGRLVKTRKYEGGSVVPSAESTGTYDAFNTRVVRTGDESDVYIEKNYEVRKSQFGGAVISGGEATKYIFAAEERVARLVDDVAGHDIPPYGSYYFLYLQNHIGSTSVVVDATGGEVVTATAQLPYGADDSTVSNPSYEGFAPEYVFTGKEEDPGVDLMYFGERYYSALLARWISPDPLEDAQGGDENRYRYVRNRPLNLFDPFGLQELLVEEKTEVAVEYIGEKFEKEPLDTTLNVVGIGEVLSNPVLTVLTLVSFIKGDERVPDEKKTPATPETEKKEIKNAVDGVLGVGGAVSTITGVKGIAKLGFKAGKMVAGFIKEGKGIYTWGKSIKSGLKAAAEAGRDFNATLKDAKAFEGFMKSGHPPDKVLGSEDAAKLFKKLKSEGWNPRVEVGGTDSKTWEGINHINVKFKGKGRDIHIAVPKDFKPPK